MRRPTAALQASLAERAAPGLVRPDVRQAGCSSGSRGMWVIAETSATSTAEAAYGVLAAWGQGHLFANSERRWCRTTSAGGGRRLESAEPYYTARQEKPRDRRPPPGRYVVATPRARAACRGAVPGGVSRPRDTAGGARVPRERRTCARAPRLVFVAEDADPQGRREPWRSRSTRSPRAPWTDPPPKVGPLRALGPLPIARRFATSQHTRRRGRPLRDPPSLSSEHASLVRATIERGPRALGGRCARGPAWAVPIFRERAIPTP